LRLCVSWFWTSISVLQPPRKGLLAHASYYWHLSTPVQLVISHIYIPLYLLLIYPELDQTLLISDLLSVKCWKGKRKKKKKENAFISKDWYITRLTKLIWLIVLFHALYEDTSKNNNCAAEDTWQMHCKIRYLWRVAQQISNMT